MEEIIRVAPYRMQLERSPRNARLLGIGDAGPTHSPTDRETSDFEFTDGAERERFAMLLSAMASPDTAATAVLLRSMSSASIVGGGGATPLGRTLSTASVLGQAGLGGAPPSLGPNGKPLVGDCGPDDVAAISKAAPGSVRSTFRAPSTGDVSGLWSASWPHDDVKVWVGTYNLSHAPPPPLAGALDLWVPAPHRDPLGPRDIYVFGLQEVGSAANREAWSNALVRHLSPPKADVSGAMAAARERATKAAAATGKPAPAGSLTDKLKDAKAGAAAPAAGEVKDVAAEVATAAAQSASKLSASETEVR